MKIEITKDDIAYAERVLLKEGETFDEERVDFISCLETTDLQAVPGSGKTTALLAKLLILERYLPLKDGAGILVLSHTNTAVDEIKEKIGKHCPHLFSYPHFIGTIQQFVNRFLVMPGANSLLGIKICSVDTDHFESRMLSGFRRIYWDTNFGKPGSWLWSRHISRAKGESIKSGLLEKDVCNSLIDAEVKGLYFDLLDEKIKTADGKTLLKDQANPKFKGFFSILNGVLKEGVVSFRYAYHLAEFYIHKKPEIVNYIRRRFLYIFVDEMQDMAPHQHDLLETLFYSPGSVSPVFQRIGDENQAIYSYKIFTDTVWTGRSNKRELKGSYRLSKPVAAAVKNFAESFQDIDARGSAEHLPVIVVYDNDSIAQVVPWFANKIQQLELDQIPDATFHAVGWVKVHGKRVAIQNYWEPFEPQKSICSKEHYTCLADYVEAARMHRFNNTFKPIERLFVSAILEVLRLEGVRHPSNQRVFTRTTLLAYLRESHSEIYTDMRRNLYRWSRAVISGNDVQSNVKDFLNHFLQKSFGQQISLAIGFISAEPSITAWPEENTEINVDVIEGIKITVGTVHSVKGKTHTATLYLETFNGGDGAGSNGYDSGKLDAPFKGNRFDGHDKAYKVKNTRVAYVGMSRPTHLLCVAIHKDRLPDVDLEKWDVVDVETGSGVRSGH